MFRVSGPSVRFVYRGFGLSGGFRVALRTRLSRPRAKSSLSNGFRIIAPNPKPEAPLLGEMRTSRSAEEWGAFSLGCVALRALLCGLGFQGMPQLRY